MDELIESKAIDDSTENESPIQVFAEVLTEGDGLDLGKEYIEIGLDSLLSEGLLKDIPAVNTAFAVRKVYLSLKERRLTKKVLIFSQKVRKKIISKPELEIHVAKLKYNRERLDKELEIILNYLDRHTKYIKGLILANFYISYLEEELEDWGDFDFFAEIVDDLSVYDLRSLIKLYEQETISNGESYNPVALQRLSSYGLVEHHDGMAVVGQEQGNAYIAKINEIGKAFCKYGIDSEISNKVMNEDIIS